MLPGILFLLLGLGIFIAAGVKLDDAPGLEKKTLLIMGIGIVLICIGGGFLIQSAFGL